MINISFSWDDGSIYDIKLAELMSKYGLNAMFFIPARNKENSVIGAEEVRELYKMGMDIGAHSYNHVYLKTLQPREIEIEIVKGKEYLEDIIKTDIDWFCYPGGHYNLEISRIAQKYFKKSRTARTMRFGIQSGFNIDTSLHFFKRGLTSIIKNMAINDPLTLPVACSSIGLNYFDSCKRILRTLDSKEKNYDLHIWGHGWEIEKFNLWNDLEDFIQFIVKNNYQVSRLKDIYL
jgi:peptidoglycan-N-acetylglucosamine deacetylase